MIIFITGAAGYIGGSLAKYFRDDGHEVLGLVRTDDNAAALARRGIEPIIGDLSNVDAIGRGTRNSDATINTAEADDVNLVAPLIAALAGTGKALIHTSGSSIVVDDAQGDTAGSVIFNDDSPFTPLPHRLKRVSVDQLVRVAGVTQGIRAAVICPTIDLRGRTRAETPHAPDSPSCEEVSRAWCGDFHRERYSGLVERLPWRPDDALRARSRKGSRWCVLLRREW
jgi:nucleoside-diphosphate-sugar epimerase